MSAEMVAFTVDYQVDFSFKNDYHKVVFRPAWLAVDNVVPTFDFTREDVLFDISDFTYCLLSEDDGRLGLFRFLFCHLPENMSPIAKKSEANIIIL